MKTNLGIMAAILTFTVAANATFSIIAGDHENRQTGSALASCTAYLGDSVAPTLSSDTTEFILDAQGNSLGVAIGQSFYFGNFKGSIAQMIRAGLNARESIKIMQDIEKAAVKDRKTRSKDNVTKLATELGIKYPVLGKAFFLALQDSSFESRQYGVLDFSHFNSIAAHTGNNDQPLVGTPMFRDDMSAVTRHFQIVNGAQVLGVPISFSIQGNTLTSAKVLKAMKRSVANSPMDSRMVCGDLVERLFLALKDGAADGGGDKRCVLGDDFASPVQRLSSNQSYLWVKDAKGNDVVKLEYRCTKAEHSANACKDAVKELESRYNEWRHSYGCKRSPNSF